LAAIIFNSLLHKSFEVKKLGIIFNKSKIETFVWLCTFGGTVILDVNYGLYFGIASSILVVIFQNQRAYTAILGQIPNTDFYEDVNICEKAIEIENIKIIRYESPIYYANAENFSYRIFKTTGVNPRKVSEIIIKEKGIIKKLLTKIRLEHGMVQTSKCTRNVADIIMNIPTNDIENDAIKVSLFIKLLNFSSLNFKH
jgi:SulP family sulfate permease